VLIAAKDFLTVVRENQAFADHYRETLSEALLKSVYAEQREDKVGARADTSLYLFNTRVADIVKASPEIVDGVTSIRETASLMAERKVDSVLVRNSEGMVVGMVTNRELKSKVVAEGLDYSTPVERIMVTPLRTAPAVAYCFDALLTMIAESAEHLAVHHRGEFIGVIGAQEMTVFLGSSPLHIFRDLARSSSLDGLSELSRKLPSLVRGLIEAGAKAAAITQMLTVFTDTLLRRVLDFVEQELGPPPCSYCWLGLGSEGRREQTFRTDQDNALLVETLSERTHASREREYFSEFSAKAVEYLERTGHPKCRNGFMASNPRWRKDLARWELCFEDWILAPMPPEIFLSSIFFDFRPVAGEPSLARALRTHVLGRTKAYPRFLKYFVKYFLLNEPPVSFFGDYLVERDESKVELLDLKTRALTPFVEFARIMALKHGISETNTLGRLQDLAASGAVPHALFSDAAHAYEFDLHLMVLHQLRKVEAGEKPDNFVRPALLSDLEKKTLKFSFSVLERMMTLVKKEFQ
jgi:CBS domain-containing protein